MAPIACISRLTVNGSHHNTEYYGGTLAYKLLLFVSYSQNAEQTPEPMETGEHYDGTLLTALVPSNHQLRSRFLLHF
jgi:hypothetical protein